MNDTTRSLWGKQFNINISEEIDKQISENIVKWKTAKLMGYTTLPPT